MSEENLHIDSVQNVERIKEEIKQKEIVAGDIDDQIDELDEELSELQKKRDVLQNKKDKLEEEIECLECDLDDYNRKDYELKMIEKTQLLGKFKEIIDYLEYKTKEGELSEEVLKLGYSGQIINSIKREKRLVGIMRHEAKWFTLMRGVRKEIT
jgi:chromosome segregation ATPase